MGKIREMSFGLQIATTIILMATVTGLFVFYTSYHIDPNLASVPPLIWLLFNFIFSFLVMCGKEGLYVFESDERFNLFLVLVFLPTIFLFFLIAWLYLILSKIFSISIKNPFYYGASG